MLLSIPNVGPMSDDCIWVVSQLQSNWMFAQIFSPVPCVDIFSQYHLQSDLFGCGWNEEQILIQQKCSAVKLLEIKVWFRVSKYFIWSCSSQAGNIYWSWQIVFFFILITICNTIWNLPCSCSGELSVFPLTFHLKTNPDLEPGALPGVLGQPEGLRDCLRIPPCLSSCR